jgi:hypothetical protein
VVFGVIGHQEGLRAGRQGWKRIGHTSSGRSLARQFSWNTTGCGRQAGRQAGRQIADTTSTPQNLRN